MKEAKALKVFSLLMLIVLVIIFFVVPVGAGQVFSDLSSEHWCYDKIIDFAEKNYVCGYEDGTFRADRTITRAEYVKIVNNFFGYELETEKLSNFSDVKSSDWFAPYVNEAVERGYITGYEDGTFRPEAPIRRQEATVILARILDIHEEIYPDNHVDGLAQYSDSDEVQEWARVAIHSYSVHNFINGYEDGSLRILKNVTRAETVELLHILEQKIIIDEDDNSGGGGSRPSKPKPNESPIIEPDIDVTLLLKLIDFDGKSSTKPSPEPGDKVKYELTIINSGENDVELNLELHSRSGEIQGETIRNCKINNDNPNEPDLKTIIFESIISDTHPIITEDFLTTVIATSNNGIEVASVKIETALEKTSAINFKKRTNKNIVMLMDLSGSMAFCTEHLSVEKGYLGEPIRYKDLSGDMNANLGDGQLDEQLDFIFDGYKIRMDYSKVTSQPWGYHSLTSGDSGEKCTLPVRVDVLIDSLRKDNGFVDIISNASKTNEEEITVTLVTFNGFFESNKESGDMSEIIGTYNLYGDNINLKSDIGNLKYKVHDGTYINTGLNNVLSISKNSTQYGLLSGDDVENYFIFFGDGAVSDTTSGEKATRADIISDLKDYFDYMYAIGFGKDFEQNTNGAKDLLAEMLKEAGSGEPILAQNANDITDAFASIAQDIATTSQTDGGWLTIEGDIFDESVSKNKVFDIAVLNENKELFVITSGDYVQEVSGEIMITWDSNGKSVATKVKFEKNDTKLDAIKIDFSGVEFSDKKGLKVVLDYKR